MVFHPKTTLTVRCLGEFDKAADEKVQPAVIVVIEPHRTGTPARTSHARFRSYIRKGPVTVVVVENAVLILREKQVGESVSVVVSDRHTHAVGIARDACGQGYVGERAIAIVAVKSVAQWFWRRIEVRWAAVHEVDIHPTVIVVVEKSAACTHGLRQVHVGRLPARVHPGYSAGDR